MARYTDSYNRPLQIHIELAQKLISQAERDLGPLTTGQRRDLLADNLTWALEYIARVVAQID